VAILELAASEGIDLAESFAYSDSITDLPMLEAVGHPVVVNPDRDLRRVAVERGWEIRTFESTVALKTRATCGPLPSAAARLPSSALTAGAWWYLRHAKKLADSRAGVDFRTADGFEKAQTVRSFFAATASNPPSTTSSNSFFMGAV
jgi:hypothetical protein